MTANRHLVGRPGKCFQITLDELTPRTCMLNIGCGNGWLERFLSAGRSSPRFHACEINARKLLDEREGFAENIFYTASSALDLPYAAGSFDLVTCFDVIEHIPRGTEADMLAEIRRVLKPGGRLLLSTPRQSVFNNLSDLTWYFGHRHYSAKGLQALIENAGFRDIQQDSQGGPYELLETWALYFYKYVLRRNLPRKLLTRFNNKIASEKPGGGISLFVTAGKSV